MTLWPNYLVERARSRPPVGCLNEIVPRSTPVVSFGNPVRATVATIGLNPASGEFLGRKKMLLSGSERRLATLESLEIQSYCDINKRLGAKIVDECAGYFDRRPLNWFLPLDNILSAGVYASYYSSTTCHEIACHLDLAQWATLRGWNEIKETDPDILKSLLSDGESFLYQQLREGDYRLVIANGITTKEWIEYARLTTWTQVDHLEGKRSVRLYAGEGGATRFLAWSCNLQRHIRSQPEHIPALIKFVATYGGTRRAT